MSSDSKASKHQLRQHLRNTLAAFDPAEKQRADAAICQKLLEHPKIQAAQIIAAFWPMPTEPDLRPALLHLQSLGKTILLPIASNLAPGTRHPAPLSFGLFTSAGELTKHPKLPIYQPRQPSPELIPQILLVPMLGFDTRGYRLGHGAGYYDRTIAQMQQSKPSLTLGIAYQCQEISQLPTEPHDIPLNIILTETRTYSLSS